ncbi:MAG: multicopper oxidase domain-containing protein [candidate division KSB1 bacterium]|nr:multicopper oxidase domain-containing protein [candidate division KSB1 bacterium]MDZ7274100.1 multicopper oxidase domain-containing protein [candidate division KSB1 bacterium]MDZ7287856.1 multicopper oxidase domain-containing protein [candidate division KSB1 bacterium]MDZ7306932.1 multicopper oxidase domain-containing protein [candidate division KSB1 bacterium]MDZ7347564.1 multicopper oxidase domain-containing protein [candidate division KSB1 bacterium]
MTLAQSNVTVWPNTTTQVIAINGSYPGPTVRIQKGQTLTVEFRNQLNQPSNIHWHGLIVPDKMDGHPKDAIAPGGSYTYTFPVINRAGTYFYHAHPHEQTAMQVYKGFAGFFIIEDPDEAQLGLPSGNYDIPLVIQDRRAATQPQFAYNPNMMEVMDGYLGDVVLVNGTPGAYLEVSRTLYRFRLLNGSNARVYRLAFSDNRNFHVIGTDGGLIDTPVQVTESLLAPGERLDILVDFSPDQIGQSVYLKSLPFAAGGVGTTYRQGIEMNLLRFDVARAESSGGKIPSSLAPIAYYHPNDAVRTRTFTLTMQMAMNGMHRINGKVFEMNRIDETVPLHELEKWQIVNTTDEFHPMHIHGLQFQVVDRSGPQNLSPVDKGWKDTVLIHPNETVNVLVRFDAYAGIYLLHCHNLEHEDDGMMLNLQVAQTTGVKEDAPIPQNYGMLHQNHPNPFTHATTIRYEIAAPQPAAVDLKVYDALGREVATLVRQRQAAGHYEIPFQGNRLPAGVYFVKLRVDGSVYSRAIQLVK